MKLEAVVLESAGVRLEPLHAGRRDALSAAICDGELWTIRETLVPHPDQLGESGNRRCSAQSHVDARRQGP